MSSMSGLMQKIGHGLFCLFAVLGLLVATISGFGVAVSMTDIFALRSLLFLVAIAVYAPLWAAGFVTDLDHSLRQSFSWWGVVYFTIATLGVVGYTTYIVFFMKNPEIDSAQFLGEMIASLAYNICPLAWFWRLAHKEPAT